MDIQECIDWCLMMAKRASEDEDLGKEGAYLELAEQWKQKKGT